MPQPAPPFLTLERTERFEKSAAKLQKPQCKQLARKTALLLENPAHPSLKAHQIKPDGYYWETYLNAGDRIIYIPEGSHLVLVDVVSHDDIDRYGKRPKQT